MKKQDSSKVSTEKTGMKSLEQLQEELALHVTHAKVASLLGDGYASGLLKEEHEDVVINEVKKGLEEMVAACAKCGLSLSDFEAELDQKNRVLPLLLSSATIKNQQKRAKLASDMLNLGFESEAFKVSAADETPSRQLSIEHLAILSSDWEVLKELLRRGINPYKKVQFYSDVLRFAILQHQDDGIKVLLENGFKIKQTQSMKESHLHTLLSRGDISIDLLELMLEHTDQVVWGEEPEKGICKESLLHKISDRDTWASDHLVKIIRWLHAKDPRVIHWQAMSNNQTLSVLHLAAPKNKVETLQVLVELGADVNATWKKIDPQGGMIPTKFTAHELASSYKASASAAYLKQVMEIQRERSELLEATQKDHDQLNPEEDLKLGPKASLRL